VNVALVHVPLLLVAMTVVMSVRLVGMIVTTAIATATTGTIVTTTVVALLTVVTAMTDMKNVTTASTGVTIEVMRAGTTLTHHLSLTHPHHHVHATTTNFTVVGNVTAMTTLAHPHQLLPIPLRLLSHIQPTWLTPLLHPQDLMEFLHTTRLLRQPRPLHLWLLEDMMSTEE
jgi:lysylphosphatidylglycerol synthetase-like protein (DUF2156 family)